MNAFQWLTGIENSHIGELGVDELAMTSHYGRVVEDIELAASTGAEGIRYGAPWAVLEPGRDRFDWTISDIALHAMEESGLDPVWDLVHFGAPSWLKGGFLDPDYPDAIAAFASAFATRYSYVRRYTPFNEPYICAFFRGGNGTWPPYGCGARSFVRLLTPILEGIRRTIAAIRTARPGAEIWLNDGADGYRPGNAVLAPLAAELESLRFMPLDLLLGKAVPGNPTREYMENAGANAKWLDRCAGDPAPIDVIGIDYYPGSEHLIAPPADERDSGDWGRRGDYSILPDPNPLGIGRIMAMYNERYGLPVYLAETSSGCAQREWLDYCLSEMALARSLGVNLVGMTWWPLFDHVDWDSGLTNLRGHICPSGLWHGRPRASDRKEGDTVATFRATVAAGDPKVLPDANLGLPFPCAAFESGNVVFDRKESR
ncbi:MAG: family 1 glycosylhydrolase [Rectinemataceae bacterium]